MENGSSHQLLSEIEKKLEHRFNQEYFDKKSIYGIEGGAEKLPVFKELSDLIRRNFFPRSLLDVGCARGYVVKHLRAKGIDACGTDISAYSIESAPDDVKPYLIVAPAHRFPFEDNSFDLVSCIEVMEHIPQILIKPTIREMKRVARERLFLTIAPEDNTDDDTHVSLFPLHVWVGLFESEGLTLDMPMTTFMRTYPIVTEMKWQPYVFRK